MYRYITCAECGNRICRAEYGSKMEITCHKCKAEVSAKVDEVGVVHLDAKPLKIIPKRKIVTQ